MPNATNIEVAQEWRRGAAARSGTMSTDGSLIHSYGLIIGVTLKDGRKIGVEHTAKGGCFHSTTTSKHVHYMGRMADLLLTPREFSGFIDHHSLEIADTLDWASRYAESKGW